MSREIWSRRNAMAGLGGAGLAAFGWREAVAQAPLGSRLPPPVASPPGDQGAFLETAFDNASRVTVPVYLNGQGPFAFVVDTGANKTVVSTEVAEACRLTFAGQAQVHGIIALQPAPLVKVGRLRVGDVVSSGLKLPCILRDLLGADGILGLDMFKGRRLTLGFRGSTFHLDSSSGLEFGRDPNSRLKSLEASVTVPARFRSGQLVILDAEAAGQPITAFLDSGSQVTIANQALREVALKARPALGEHLIHSELMSATGQSAPADFGPLPDLRIGGQLLDKPMVAFADLHIFQLWDLQSRPTLLVGVDVLRRFDQVAFDFGKKLITFWPSRLPPRTRPPLIR
jgi:hypothetical protein